MKPSAFLAAIGAAAVLGGLVGAGTMRATSGDGRVNASVAVDTPLPVAAQPPPAADRVEDLDRHWFCNEAGGVAYRCARYWLECNRWTLHSSCIKKRIAWCSVDEQAVANRALECWGTLDGCEHDGRRCIGVE